MAMLELTFLTIGSFSRIVCYGVVPMYGCTSIRYENDLIHVTGPFDLRCWTLSMRRLFWTIDEYDLDPVLSLLVLARAIENGFGVADEPDWFPFILKDSIVRVLKTFENSFCSDIMHPAVLVRYQDD